MGTDAQQDVLRTIYPMTERMRWLLLVHALVVNALRFGEVPHPLALGFCSVVMLVWTGVVGRLQSRPASRTRSVMVGDLVVTAGLLAASPWVLGPGSGEALTIPSFWLLAAPLAMAVWGGARWGLGAGGLLFAVRLVPLNRVDARGLGFMGVVILLAWGLGTIVDTLRATVSEREADSSRAAVLAERDRMNRIVHDGALQVLAMVEREGPDLGPKGVYLANVARQQESKLRAMLQDRNVELPTIEAATRSTDVCTMLERHDSDTVTVSLMAGEVMMDATRAHELDAAVSEVLANVAKHAGPQARVWILVEDEDGELIVSVRDNGRGMTREQVQQASSGGRLGIQNSILGRIADIGGVAVARSAVGRGVEWEFRVPIEEER